MDWCMNVVRQLMCNQNEILASGQWVHILPYHAVSYLIPTPPSLVTDSSPASHVRNLLLVDITVSSSAWMYRPNSVLFSSGSIDLYQEWPCVALGLCFSSVAGQKQNHAWVGVIFNVTSSR